MDTVILAAGKGERLSGIIAPYHKPLLLVSGQPIVQQAADRGRTAANGRVIVVVAPENASPISSVLGERPITMIVQRTPNGPGRALALGLELCRSERVLVLMGDNVTTYADISKCAQATYAVGVQAVTPTEAERFTWRNRHGEWVEKQRPLPEDDTVSGILAWVGPLVIDRDAAMELYRNSFITDIGPHLHDLVPTGASLTCVPVSTYDIGVPEALCGGV